LTRLSPCIRYLFDNSGARSDNSRVHSSQEPEDLSVNSATGITHHYDSNHPFNCGVLRLRIELHFIRLLLIDLVIEHIQSNGRRAVRESSELIVQLEQRSDAKARLLHSPNAHISNTGSVGLLRVCSTQLEFELMATVRSRTRQFGSDTNVNTARQRQRQHVSVRACTRQLRTASASSVWVRVVAQEFELGLNRTCDRRIREIDHLSTAHANTTRRAAERLRVRDSPHVGVSCVVVVDVDGGSNCEAND
jgi:hypothetical protein